MAKTVVGLYGSSQAAEDVYQDLLNAGFRREDISVTARAPQDALNPAAATGRAGTVGLGDDYVAGGAAAGAGNVADGYPAGRTATGAMDTTLDNDRTGTVHTDTDRGSHAASGAATGAGVGAAIGGVGGLLAGLGLLAIPGIGPIVAAGPLVAALAGAGVGAAAGGLVGGLIGLGIPDEEAGLYAEGVRRGGYLVVVNAPDAEADRAAEILDAHDPIDIQERESHWRESGWQGYDEQAPAYEGASLGEERIPVVEESLAVGKREVERGAVRVRSYVVERPIETDVTLRDETVHVERRPVDRDLGAGDEAFRERTIEMHETDQEAVVAKQQRVVEEVVVRKDVNERTQHISDTVRKTEVEVDQPAVDRDRTPRR